MNELHTVLNIIDNTGNCISFYPENSSDDVILSSKKHTGETLSSVIDNMNDIVFSESISSEKININDIINSNIPQSSKNLRDVISKLGPNAFTPTSSVDSALRAYSDEDGINLKENYLKKVNAEKDFVSKASTATWEVSGKSTSNPVGERIFLVGSKNTSDSTEILGKSPDIFIQGNTLTAPNIQGTATYSKKSDVATNAVNDANGNNIKLTYAEKNEVNGLLKDYVAKESTVTWEVTDNKVASINTVDKSFLLGSTTSESETGTATKNRNIYMVGSTMVAPYFSGKASSAIADKNGNDISETYLKNDGGVITGPITSLYDIRDIDPDTTLVTKKYVKKVTEDLVMGDISSLIDVMVFKGTIGTPDSDQPTLPTSDIRKGYAYKVISDSLEVLSNASSTGSGFTAKNGDLIISVSDNPILWTLVPSADEPTTSIRFSKISSDLTEAFKVGEVTLGEASVKQVTETIGSTGKLITDTAVDNALKDYVTKEDLPSFVSPDNKVETSPSENKFFIVGSDTTTTTTSKLSKNVSIFVERNELHAPTFVGELMGKSTSSSISDSATRAIEDGNGNNISETYTSKKYLSDELLKYVPLQSTATWAVTDRNVASIIGQERMYLTGSENSNTCTGILQKNQSLFYENETLNSPKFKGDLEGIASKALQSDSSTKALQDGNGHIFSDYYIAKKDTATWDVTPNTDTNVKNTVSDEKIYITGSSTPETATEEQLKSRHVYILKDTINANCLNGDLAVPNVKNDNIKSNKMSDILNSLGAMAFRNSGDSMNPNVIHIFDGGSPADLV